MENRIKFKLLKLFGHSLEPDAGLKTGFRVIHHDHLHVSYPCFEQMDRNAEFFNKHPGVCVGFYDRLLVGVDFRRQCC